MQSGKGNKARRKMLPYKQESCNENIFFIKRGLYQILSSCQQRLLYSNIHMHITIKHRSKQQHKHHLLHKVKELYFTSNDFISMQIKNQIQTKSKPSHESQRKKIIINRILANAPLEKYCEQKASRETTASGFTSLEHSVDMKRAVTIQNPEKSMQAKQYIKDLNNKSNNYAIKWKTPISKITKNMRVILGEWLMEVSEQLQMPKNIVYNALYYVDKYIATTNVAKSQYQQIGLCALFIASKLQVSGCPRIDTFLQAMDGACTKGQLIQLEQKMVLKLKFKLNPPTLYQYMILLISLFSNFQDSHFLGFVDVSKSTYLWNNIFWTLDTVLLEDNYKSFKDKEKVCLSILYINIKKEKMRNVINGKNRLLSELQNLNVNGEVEKNMELFMEKLIKLPIKVNDLKEYIRAFKKWAKYEVRGNEINYSELKNIVLKEL